MLIAVRRWQGSFGSQGLALRRTRLQVACKSICASGVLKGPAPDTLRSGMSKRTSSDRSLRTDTEGLTTVEYIVLLFLLVIPAIIAWEEFGCTLEEKAVDASFHIDDLAG